VLIFIDEPAFSGCVAAIRLVGVIEAEESQPGRPSVENDRLVVVAAVSIDRRNLLSLKKVSPELVEEIEHFFCVLCADGLKTGENQGSAWRAASARAGESWDNRGSEEQVF
jgi:hypothetical protein